MGKLAIVASTPPPPLETWSEPGKHSESDKTLTETMAQQSGVWLGVVVYERETDLTRAQGQ